MRFANSAEVDDVVRAAVAWATGLDSSAVIPGNSEGPLPLAPYASATRIMDDQLGTARLENESAGQRVTLLRRATYRVWFYRAGARANADKLLARFQGDGARGFLWARGLALFDVGRGELPDEALVDGVWQGAALVRLEVDYALSPDILLDAGRVDKATFTLNGDSPPTMVDSGR